MADSLDQRLENRELGQVGVSMGTSLAIESAFGIYPEAERSPPPIREYRRFFFNISTMIRNLINTLEAAWQQQLEAGTVSEFILEEMRIIDAWIQDQAGGRVDVHFYYNDRSRLKRFFPEADFKQAKTTKQILFESIEQDVARSIFRQRLDLNHHYYHVLLEPPNGNCLVNTHLPIDLLSYRKFDKLDLVESHQGTIRQRRSWGHKLTIRDESMPFNPYTYQLFGDQRDVNPQPKKVRAPILELARSKRWSPTTTHDKIERSIEQIEDDEIRQIHRQLLRRARSFPTFS